MTDSHKLKTIDLIKEKLKKDKKILLISTQSIEAGVDLSFEVGFREVSPVSSIIQTAGRINRNNEFESANLYVFKSISKYENLIYGNLQTISENIIEILKQKYVKESEILEFSTIYFEIIHKNLENLYINDQISKLEFETINNKINEIMKENDYKKLIIVEPKPNFIKNLEQEFFEFKNDDKFKIKEFRNNIIKQITTHGVNVSEHDTKKFETNLEALRFCEDISYLPYGCEEYDKHVGILKDYTMDFAS